MDSDSCSTTSHEKVKPRKSQKIQNKVTSTDTDKKPEEKPDRIVKTKVVKPTAPVTGRRLRTSDKKPIVKKEVVKKDPVVEVGKTVSPSKPGLKARKAEVKDGAKTETGPNKRSSVVSKLRSVRKKPTSHKSVSFFVVFNLLVGCVG